MSEELKSWPERVWLQGGEESIETYPGAHPDLTWCEAKYNAGDIEYVRADLARRIQPERMLIDIWHNIQQILKGIDDCSPNDDAYWETSVGAQFGKEKLAEIKALLIDK